MTRIADLFEIYRFVSDLSLRVDGEYVVNGLEWRLPRTGGQLLADTLAPHVTVAALRNCCRYVGPELRSDFDKLLRCVHFDRDVGRLVAGVAQLAAVVEPERVDITAYGQQQRVIETAHHLLYGERSQVKFHGQVLMQVVANT